MILEKFPRSAVRSVLPRQGVVEKLILPMESFTCRPFLRRRCDGRWKPQRFPAWSDTPPSNAGPVTAVVGMQTVRRRSRIVAETESPKRGW
jgi:hypothetical protein